MAPVPLRRAPYGGNAINQLLTVRPCDVQGAVLGLIERLSAFPAVERLPGAAFSRPVSLGTRLLGRLKLKLQCSDVPRGHVPIAE